MRYLLVYLSWRYWLRHRGAFALAALGVAMGVAVFVAVQVANSSVLGAFSASLDAVSGKTNLQVRGGPNGVPEELFVKLKQKQDSRIQAIAPVISRMVLAPKLKSSLLITGVDLFSEAEFRDYSLEETESHLPAEAGRGGLLRFFLDPKAIAISDSFARQHRLKEGSSLMLVLGARRETFNVAAILRSEQAGRVFGGDFAVMDIAAAQEALGETSRLSRIDMVVDEAQIDAVTAEIKKLAPADAIVGRPAQRAQQVAAMLGAFQLNLTALSSIALFVGAFLIYNAMASAVTRRRTEAGILRAVGASSGQLTALFVVEAGIIGLFGSVCGFLLGLVLARWTLGAVATTVSQLYLAVKAREILVAPWLMWAAPLTGTLVSMLAAIPAAREAAGTSPRAALTGLTLHHATEKMAPKLAIGGVLLLGLAVLLCRPEIGGRAPIAGFAAAGATLGAFAAFAPIVTWKVGQWIRPLAERFGGIEGALAADDLRRALNRSSLAIAALATSLALTIGMNIMVQSFRGTVAEWIDNTVSADLFIAPANGFDGERTPGLPSELVKYATSRPELEAVDTLRPAEVELNGRPVMIMANTLPSLEKGLRRIRYVATARGQEAAEADFEAGKCVLISERVSHLLNLKAGGSLTLPTPHGDRIFPIGGVFFDYNPNDVIYLNRKVYSQLWDDPHVDALALYLKKGASIEATRRDLQDRYGGRYALLLLPNKDIRREVFDTFDQTFAVTYALQLIALLVAAVGVFDTLVSLLLERQQEMASLRAMGMSKTQLRKMNLMEFSLMALFSWGLSVAAGLFLAWQMIYVINRQFFGWTIFWKLPPGVLIQALVLAFVAALGAGLWPARAAMKRDLASLLQRE